MKKLKTTISSIRLDPLTVALSEIGIQGMTVTEAKDLAAESAGGEESRTINVEVSRNPKAIVEVVVHDDLATQVIDIINQIAGAGRSDDAEILVSEVIDAIRIRTGESGDAAI